MSHRHPTVPDFWSDAAEHRRKLAGAVNGLLKGQLNNHYEVTLTPDETTTELVDPNITAETGALLSPLSASAALALANLYSVPTVGSVTFHHDSTSDTDRTFRIFLFG
jgi:hypothetical protein